MTLMGLSEQNIKPSGILLSSKDLNETIAPHHIILNQTGTELFFVKREPHKDTLCKLVLRQPENSQDIDNFIQTEAIYTSEKYQILLLALDHENDQKATSTAPNFYILNSNKVVSHVVRMPSSLIFDGSDSYHDEWSVDLSKSSHFTDSNMMQLAKAGFQNMSVTSRCLTWKHMNLCLDANSARDYPVMQDNSTVIEV